MPLSAQFENKVKENKNMQFLCNVMQLLSVCTFFEKFSILRVDAQQEKKRRGVTRENMINMLEWKEK